MTSSDPFVKIYGSPEAITQAREMIGRTMQVKVTQLVQPISVIDHGVSRKIALLSKLNYIIDFIRMLSAR